jgi:TolB-like protein/Tfp pilus assembly protein PilF
LPDKPSIIVLPFVNLSGDPGQEYFSDGFTEEITATLSRVAGLFVIARTSAFTYKGKGVKVQDISRELGVRYVLEGSVRKADGRLRIIAQLIDATTGEHLWAESYDRELKDIFAVQDEVRQKIVFALKVKLTPEEQERFRRFPTNNLEAYDFFLRGDEYAYRFTKEAITQERQMYEKALALDPQYAGAYAGLGWTYFLDWGFHWSHEPQTLERAFELAQRAIVLDDSLPDAHLLLGQVYAQKNQPEQALAEVERAIALAPNYVDSYATLADILNSLGKPQEALEMAEKALRLDPRSRYTASYLYELGVGYFFTGRIEEAIAAFKRTLMHDPNYQLAYTFLTSSYVVAWVWQLTQDPQVLERAFEAAQKAVALNDSLPFAHAELGNVYLLQKRHDQARAEAERVIALNPNLAEGYALLARILGFTGKPQEALEMAEKAVRLNPRFLFELGFAYYSAGRYEEATATLKKLLSHNPNLLHVQLVLVLASSEAGQEEEARAAAVEVLRINPNFSLEVMKQRALNTDPATVERNIAALRKAGLK